MIERVDELDGGGPRVLDVARHAAAGIQQQAEVQRRRFLRRAGGEIFQRLRLSVLEDLEVFRRQARDGLALLVDDGDAEVHEIDRRAEGRLLRAEVRRPRPGTNEAVQTVRRMAPPGFSRA